MPVKPIPDHYHSVTPYLIVHDAAAAIDYYKRALGATELMRLPRPDGKVAHAEIKIGDSTIMLADEAPQMGARSPKTIGGSPVSIMLYVENVNDRFPKAIAAGGKEIHPLKDQFYGDRSGTLEDPFGHTWTIGSHVEDVSPEEINKRMAAMTKGQGA
ncbi:MAG TPA: VOC family protein [Pirellulales bacterium]|jgi:PhnB protein|nr:VOC family protein [Pirellulales bacterium]